MKVLLSTYGPLHLIKSSEYLSKFVDIKIIEGFVPRWYNKFILYIFSIFYKRDIVGNFKNRSSRLLKNIYSNWIPEVYSKILNIFSLNKDLNNYKTAVLYGKISRKYIKNADIFHVRSGYGQGGAILKAKQAGMKIICDHSIAHPAFMEKNLKKLYEQNDIKFDLGLESLFWKCVLQDCIAADCLLVNSEFVKQTFVKENFDSNKIKVVYLGVNENFFKLKKNYDKSQVLKILFIGSFDIRKGGLYILKALKNLNLLDIDFELTIIGKTHELQKQIKESRLNINCTGFLPQNEIKKYLINSDIFLFPTLCEGCAQSCMEALAAGLPVITTKESGTPIINRVDGIIIDSHSVEQIVNSIIELNNSKELRMRLGQSASEKISKNYTWENYAIKVKQLYDKILND